MAAAGTEEREVGASPGGEGALADRLARAITLAGPMPVSRFMAAANAHYYATRDPLGAGGDFVTSPEISQMFGELVGLWAADLWDRAGRPDAAWVELGPGRGTLSVDALRAMAKAGWRPPVHLVETSPTLRSVQGERIAGATWHDSVDTLPDDRPLIVVANEFFDALPIRQLVKRGDGWHERLVACQDTLFLPIAGPPVPDAVVPESLRDAPAGAMLEVAPAAVAVIRSLGERLRAQGGSLLAIDYGHEGPALGDTFQAVRGHAFANPFDAPGEQDLSAHVDFTTLAAAGQAHGLAAWGPVEQAEWLIRLGIDARAAALARATPDRGDDIAADRMRLVNGAEANGMGALFKVLALTAPGWPGPAGFA
ncbi:SAM-dependent methyltransferase, MidA family [Sphingomonas gellani]|uniref:SAM-dependent methyltransferase, MidA family n=1 Tax=Sphingomonas gellani TaxID=1166340 RepID=A0A1H8CBD0_9SPHN|nr:SAM-dependent methyltransferase [Sphingomonas gellani]SEM92320.1 SAM-dependent methyltransferase, MidA family [Sphingomonas gellani]